MVSVVFYFSELLWIQIIVAKILSYHVEQLYCFKVAFSG